MIRAARVGSVLLITAALCALLVMLTFAFLIAMRADAQATGVVLGHAQARIMLMAACNYILETGRIGWGQECSGWVDVRDGKLGPKPANSTQPWKPASAGLNDDSRFPIGRPARFPLYCWTRPPFAISPRDPNPIDTALLADGITPADATRFGQPFVSNPDPLPASEATNYATWKTGVPAARPGTLAMGWFRILRDGPATFIVTCGSGGSYGFRDWADVDAISQAGVFAGSQALFEQAVDAEVRTWYRLEWSPAVPLLLEGNLANEDQYSFKGSYNTEAGWGRSSLHPGRDNVCGTIQWVQRLRYPPDAW